MAERGAPGQDAASSSGEPELSGPHPPGSIPWTAPLAWLEQALPGSPVLTALRHSLLPPSPRDGDTSVTPPSVVAPVSTPGLLGASTSAPLGEGPTPWRQDACTSTPLPVPAWTALASPPAAPPEASMEEKSPVLPRATGPTCDVSPEGPAETSPPPPSPPATSVGTAPEELPPALPQDWLASIGLTSPLSFLEPGLSPMPAEPPAPSRCSTAPGPLPACTATTEVQTSPLGLPGTQAAQPPVPREERGTCVTPVCVAPAAAWTSPPERLEAAVNTSLGQGPPTTERAAETDSLLWHCSRDHLESLSRTELQRRLESTLIIVEVLAHQIRATQEPRPAGAHVGPAEERDVGTQTPFSQPEEDEYRNLYVALSRRHQALQCSRESQRMLAQQLTGAVGELARWSSASQLLQDTAEASFRRLQEDRRALAQQQSQVGALLARCRHTLQESGRKRREMKAELEEAQDAHQAVCRQLEERTVEVVEALGRVAALAEANAGLERDLRAARQRGAAAEDDLERLRQESATLAQQVSEKEGALRALEEKAAGLSREKERAEEELACARWESRAASECREFLEQENRIASGQLSEMEQELKTTLAALWQRSGQLEDQKDASARLRREHEALGAELASCQAELQRARDGTAALAPAVQGVGALQAQFLQVADLLRAALPSQEPESPQRRRGDCSPAHPTPRGGEASFVDSVLQAAAEQEAETPGLWSRTTAFAKVAPAATPTLPELRERLDAGVQELRETAEQLRLLGAQCRSAQREEVARLEAEISQLQRQLDGQATELRGEIEADRARIAQLHGALQTRIQSEKELREALFQQTKNLEGFYDQSSEIRRLQVELDQLRQLLQKAEAEAEELWTELRGTRPAEEAAVQERVLLKNHVTKLRELLLLKDEERVALVSEHLRQVQSLERQLHEAQEMLRKRRKAEAEMREVLCALPVELAGALEVQRLSELLA